MPENQRALKTGLGVLYFLFPAFFTPFTKHYCLHILVIVSFILLPKMLSKIKELTGIGMLHGFSGRNIKGILDVLF
jgi:hypothetical protein